MNNRSTTVPAIQQRARELRVTMTSAEVRLWQRLRGDQMLGLRFRRQEPMGNFIADFFCAAARLVIELDGASHEGRVEPDRIRDEVLTSEGYAVLRFQNDEVLHNMMGVLETIESYCRPFCQVEATRATAAPKRLGGEEAKAPPNLPRWGRSDALVRTRLLARTSETIVATLRCR